jgi:hypothetical protein
MTRLIPVGHDKRETDGGKTQRLIHCLVDGQPKTMTKADYFKLIELMLPEGPPPKENQEDP